MKKFLLLTTLLSLGLASGPAQTPERGERNIAPGDAVVGKVTSIGKDSLVISPLMGGDPVTVRVGDNTRVNKDRQPAKLEEIKTGDLVFVRGALKNGAIEAAMVGVVNPQMNQRFEQGGAGPGGFGGGPGGGGPVRFNQDDLGKKFIAGEVKAINETKLTIARPDGQSQDIEVDENTSFKRANESITLPDIKVGDFVHGPGELKNSVFVAKELMIGRPPMRMMMVGPENAPQQNAPADKPSAPAPPKN
jgi:Domain of unknown function (DUF5666)